MAGKPRMGATEIGSPSLKRSIRVMHMSRGLPLISTLHEPHLPALQFQRTARSVAWRRWTSWMASRTTHCGEAATVKSAKSPPAALPRQIRSLKSTFSDTAGLQILERGVVRQRLLQLRPLAHDADVALHGGLQLLVDEKRVLAMLAVEDLGRAARDGHDLLVVERGPRLAHPAGVLRRADAREPPEDE